MSWVSTPQATDALRVWGGNVLYLGYWMHQSGLAPGVSPIVHRRDPNSGLEQTHDQRIIVMLFESDGTTSPGRS